jgi:hypothetical protein
MRLAPACPAVQMAHRRGAAMYQKRTKDLYLGNGAVNVM